MRRGAPNGASKWSGSVSESALRRESMAIPIPMRMTSFYVYCSISGTAPHAPGAPPVTHDNGRYRYRNLGRNRNRRRHRLLRSLWLARPIAIAIPIPIPISGTHVYCFIFGAASHAPRAHPVTHENGRYRNRYRNRHSGASRLRSRFRFRYQVLMFIALFSEQGQDARRRRSAVAAIQSEPQISGVVEYSDKRRFLAPWHR